MRTTKPSGYRQRALSGASWHTFFKASTTILSAVKLYIIARLLTPTDFGLFSLVAIALGITEALTETGINTFLLQTKDRVEKYVNTAWVIALVRGTVIAVVMVGLGAVLQQFYDEPRLWSLIALAAGVPLIKGFINPMIITMNKELAFWRDTAYRISLSLVEMAVSIGLALWWQDVSVLIWGMIAAAGFEVVMSWFIFSVKPRWQWSAGHAREIFRQSRGLNLAALLSYAHENADNLVIGKLFGTTQVGYYQQAYALSHKANFDFAYAVHYSTFPIFARLDGDAQRLWRAFWHSRSLTMLGLFVVSIPLLIKPELTVWLLGDQWYPAVPLVAPLVWAGLAQSAGLLIGTLLLIKRQYFWTNMYLAIATGSMVLGLLWLAPSWGPVGATWVILGSRIVALPAAVIGLGLAWRRDHVS